MPKIVIARMTARPPFRRSTAPACSQTAAAFTSTSGRAPRTVTAPARGFTGSPSPANDTTSVWALSPVVSLAEARRRVLKQRLAILDGEDPLAAKQAGKVPTFRAAAEATYERLRPGWRSALEAGAWRQRLEKHANAGPRRPSR